MNQKTCKALRKIAKEIALKDNFPKVAYTSKKVVNKHKHLKEIIYVYHNTERGIYLQLKQDNK